ncbi:MAG: SAM-dependent methyltransferase [Alphaproteobacteria bacterium]|nr:SAM-dependent methyltransferase [Alphaproteobacteria bacterium]
MIEKSYRFEETLFSLVHTLGAMNIAQYMALVAEEYYNKKDPIGRRGSFITAPEISQMFGEMIGVWCAHTWSQMKDNHDLLLVEFGPGKGTMMSDILRATKHIPGFHDSISIHMVEKSASLTKAQQANLKDFHPRIQWHASLQSLPAKPAIFISNEFFDALPIHQFIKSDKGWREHLVAVHPNHERSLAFALSPSSTPSCTFIPSDHQQAPEGSVYEFCPAAVSIIQHISKHLLEHGGAALTIDYGYTTPTYKGTLQAVNHHEKQHVLLFPGDADITAHVDFSQLTQTAKSLGMRTYPTIDQGTFLHNLGIQYRLEILQKQTNDKQKESLQSEYQRLTSPSEMGELFKVFAFSDVSQKPLAGF